MAKSKIDRIGEVMREMVADRFLAAELELRRNGNTQAADALKMNVGYIAAACVNPTHYQRLELDDIIKGHKRAWPE